ncbi:MAG: hypothetical protein LBU83_01840 [Bacteroidales bacterium]|jgi:hypothetical protein|nr:hypothetical protein [Bacteroidales bacterium]
MKNLIFLLTASYLCLSCFDIIETESEHDFSKRTVLVYMAADNNLYRSAYQNIGDMVAAEIPRGYNLLVYIDTPYDNPYLLNIKKGKIDTLKQYNPQSSVSGQVLKSVIDKAFSLFPAESYGLILWSHGTGWLPDGTYDNLKKIHSFGSSNDGEMEIEDLAEAIPENLDFIIFDACLMSGIEVLYQLRNKAKIIIASPTEVLIAGFPYKKTIPPLLMPEPNYKEVALTYMEYYKNRTGNLRSASIAIIDTRQLEQLAYLVRSAIREEVHFVCPNKNFIQRYDTRNPALFFDFEDYLEHAITNESNLMALKAQISKTVIYNDFTPYFLDEFPIEKSCGIGIYVPFENDILYEQYRSLDWYKDSELFCS